MVTNNISKLCMLALMIGIGTGCRKNTGSHNFSYSFDSDKADALVTASKMYSSFCQALESRDFVEMDMTESPDKKSAQYEGKFEGFPLTVKIHYLLSVSDDKPEFYYRVSFQETGAIGELNEAAKELRVLMETWCNHAE